MVHLEAHAVSLAESPDRTASCWSPRSVDLAAVVDREDRHDPCWVVDLVDNAVITAVRTALVLELEAQLMANAPEIVGKSAVHELHHCGCDLLGKPRQVPQGTGCPRDLERLSVVTNA